jgi:hypothetical protein
VRKRGEERCGVGGGRELIKMTTPIPPKQHKKIAKQKYTPTVTPPMARQHEEPQTHEESNTKASPVARATAVATIATQWVAGRPDTESRSATRLPAVRGEWPAFSVSAPRACAFKRQTEMRESDREREMRERQTERDTRERYEREGRERQREREREREGRKRERGSQAERGRERERERERDREIEREIQKQIKKSKYKSNTATLHNLLVHTYTQLTKKFNSPGLPCAASRAEGERQARHIPGTSKQFNALETYFVGSGAY